VAGMTQIGYYHPALWTVVPATHVPDLVYSGNSGFAFPRRFRREGRMHTTVRSCVAIRGTGVPIKRTVAGDPRVAVRHNVIAPVFTTRTRTATWRAISTRMGVEARQDEPHEPRS